MRKPARFLLVGMTAFGLTAQVQAQESRVKDWSYRAEVFGLFGNGRLYNGDNLWGSGLEYGGGIGVRPFSGWMKRIGFEFEGVRYDAGTKIGFQMANIAFALKDPEIGPGLRAFLKKEKLT